MSAENVEAIRAAFERYARGDFSDWTDRSGFTFVTSAEMPDAGAYTGEAAAEWMQAWVDSFEDLRIEATEIIDAGGDKVVVAITQRGRPRGTDTLVEGSWWLVMTLSDGQATRAEAFAERAEALEAAGLGDS